MLSCQRPLTLHFACTRSIGRNEIGAEGGKAIAAVLKDTQITNLKLASALKPGTVLAFVSAPLNMHFSCTLACSLEQNYIGVEGGSALAAILSQTSITNLKCIMISNPDSSVCFPVSAP